MELIFLFISVIITLISIYLLGRIVNTHDQLLRSYKTDEFLFLVHLLMGVVLATMFFIILCAFNNTFWNLPYLIR